MTAEEVYMTIISISDRESLTKPNEMQKRTRLKRQKFRDFLLHINGIPFKEYFHVYANNINVTSITYDNRRGK